MMNSITSVNMNAVSSLVASNQPRSEALQLT